ncbi:MAG: carbohydrate kinase [Pseudomonadota bacterium]
MIEVISLGEMIVDMIAEGERQFCAHPGGAPANVAMDCVRLGHSAAFIGKRGNDAFGNMLNQTLEQKGVDATGFTSTDEANTGLAFVFRKEAGEPSFFFYRNPGADELLDPEDIPSALFDGPKWFHFGSISLYHDRSRAATEHACKLAKDNNLIVSYDPNLRPHLLRERKGALDAARNAARYADVIKLGEKEALLITGESDEKDAVKSLFKSGIKMIAITRGSKGSSLILPHARADAFPPKVSPVDTTGAGDAFTAALICGMLEGDVFSNDDIASLDDKRLSAVLEFASAVSAKSTEAEGATAGVKRWGERP